MLDLQQLLSSGRGGLSARGLAGEVGVELGPSGRTVLQMCNQHSRNMLFSSRGPASLSIKPHLQFPLPPWLPSSNPCLVTHLQRNSTCKWKRLLKRLRRSLCPSLFPTGFPGVRPVCVCVRHDRLRATRLTIHSQDPLQCLFFF